MSSHRSRIPFLERSGPFGLSVALLILMAFFFVLPSAFRGARMGLKNKENDIKDWLPSDFPETAELDWFADHFAGESFVLATWPGCNVGDQRLQLLEEKLLHESAQFKKWLDVEPQDADGNPLSEEDLQTRLRARALGQKLELLPPGQPLNDWGGRDEKWLASSDGTWYFLTPDGHLYRWEGSISGPAALLRAIRRAVGRFELKGQLVTAFGKPSTEQRVNPFYNDPSLLSAPLFETVQTGATIAEELAAEGGPLWPIDLTDPSQRPRVARRRALERLTGTLFAPAVPPDFRWTPEAFAAVLTPEAKEILAGTAAQGQDAAGPPSGAERNADGRERAGATEDSPTAASGSVEIARRSRAPGSEGFEFMVRDTLAAFAQERLDGELERLRLAPMDVQTDAWYAVFDRLEVPPPPRLTCLLVTLTDVAKDNLAYAIGRGTMGTPRGRLLELAAQCGVSPPAPPSTAPPPFNREAPDSIGGLPPLRMGGPPVDNIAIDEEGTVTLARLIGYCILVGVALSYICFRSLKVTIMLFLVGGASAMLAMAVVGWTGGRVDAILMSMPSLVYVLGLSGAIHVINYYRDEVRFSGRRGAASRAFRHALVPCSLAALTTAIGLASLFTSNLKPISNFGLYSAIGVISTLAILFSYLPAALEVFAPRLGKTGETGAATGQEETAKTADASADVFSSADAAATTPSPAASSELARWWASIGTWITSHHAVVSISCLAILFAASLGVFKVKTSVQLLKLFDEDARILRDYAWLEEHFGKLVPMEIVMRMPPEVQRAKVAASGESPSPISLTLLERVEAISRIRTAVKRTLGEQGSGVVGQASSMDTFLPPLPEVSNGYDVVRSNFQRQLTAGYDELLDSDYLKVEKHGPLAGSELWRLSLRVGALSDVDYGLFINDLRDVVAPVVQAYQVRAEVLERLAAGQQGINGKQRLLILGSREVENLQTADLISSDGTVDQRAIFLATLKELLGNERLTRVYWIDPADPNAPIQPGAPKWDRFLSAVDLICDVQSMPQRFLPHSGSTLEPVADPVPEAEGPDVAVSLAGVDHVLDVTSIAKQETRKRIVTLAADHMTPRDQKAGDRDGRRVAASGGDLQRVPVFQVSRPETPQVVYTGIVPVVYKAQRTLLGSLFESILLAFVLIGLVMVVLLNPGAMPVQWMRPAYLGSGITAGLISMIPNVFPVLIVFGMMGHLNEAFPGEFLVDIGTMMTASVAMGVAVDDTIHFLSWFRQFLNEGKTRVEAVIETYKRVGPAMTQTTIVGGLGLFIFALSTFTPTQRFGTLMLVMLATALVGDLILLPALLAGPLGRFFKPHAGSLATTAGPLSKPPVGGGLATGQPASDTEPASTVSEGEDEPDPESPTTDPRSEIPVLKLHRPASRQDSAHIHKRK